MSGVVAGLALAVTASLALNGAFLLQHVGAAAAPRIAPLRLLGTVRGLVRSRVWMAGLALGLAGWGLHVAALARAPLSLVQPFVAGGLVLAVPLAVCVLGHAVTRREGVAVALMALALALLSIGLTAPHSADHVPGVGPGGFVASACLVACALAAVQHGRLGGAALGALGGALYGAGDLATKALVSSGSLVATWAFVVAIATLGAFFCFQRGLQLGPPLAVIALMTAATNLVSIAGAVVVLGEPVGSTPALETLHGLALVLVAGAAWMLAPVQAALVGVPIHRRRTAPRRGRRVPLPVRGPSG